MQRRCLRAKGDQLIVHIPVQNQRIPSLTVYDCHRTHVRRTRCSGRSDSSIPTTILSIATTRPSRSMRQLYPHLLCQSQHACRNSSRSLVRYTLFGSHRTSSDFSNSPNLYNHPGIAFTRLPFDTLQRSQQPSQFLQLLPPSVHEGPTAQSVRSRPLAGTPPTKLASQPKSHAALERTDAPITPGQPDANASSVVLTIDEELFSKALLHSTTI